MDSKLELFLSKINLSKDDYKYFEDGKILKIISSKDKLNWNFVIETKELLPTNILEYLDENISNGFSNLNTVTYTIKPININKSLINDYFNYVIKSMNLGKAISMIFLGKTIKYTTNGLVLEAFNKAEENMINSKLKSIINTYNKIGFTDFSLSIESIKEDSEVKTEIENELKKEVDDITKNISHMKSIPKERPKERMQMVSTKKDPDSNAILGFEIKDESVPINTITGEMEDVTVEGFVFGKEEFESPKSNFKIITLSVSDETDSLLSKIFFRRFL